MPISAQGFNDGSTVSTRGFNIDAENTTTHGLTILAASGGNRGALLPLSPNCIQPCRIQPQRNVKDRYVADKLAMAPPSPQRKKRKVSNNLKPSANPKPSNVATKEILEKAAGALAALEKLLAKKEKLTAALERIAAATSRDHGTHMWSSCDHGTHVYSLEDACTHASSSNDGMHASLLGDGTHLPLLHARSSSRTRKQTTFLGLWGNDVNSNSSDECNSNDGKDDNFDCATAGNDTDDDLDDAMDDDFNDI